MKPHLCMVQTRISIWENLNLCEVCWRYSRRSRHSASEILPAAFFYGGMRVYRNGGIEVRRSGGAATRRHGGLEARCRYSDVEFASRVLELWTCAVGVQMWSSGALEGAAGVQTWMYG